MKKAEILEILVQFQNDKYIVRFNAFSVSAINFDTRHEVMGILLDSLVSRAETMVKMWSNGDDYLPLVRKYMRN